MSISATYTSAHRTAAVNNITSSPQITNHDHFVFLLDRSALGLIAESDSSTISKLQTLLTTYRKGLANLLLSKCYYQLIQGEYMEVFYCANELVNVAQQLSDSEFLQFSNSLMSKKFVKDNIADRQAGLLKAYFNATQNNRIFIEKLTRNELTSQEYKLLCTLYSEHILHCDFQFCVDLCNRLLEITCMLKDRESIIDTLANFSHLAMLLGKYRLSYDILIEMQTFKTDYSDTEYIVLCNLSVVELLLGHKQESLKHAQDSLILALLTEDLGHIACAYGNIGLAYEYMKRYDEAIEPYQECLRLGEKAHDNRVINNGLCNLGRAYQGLGNIKKAKEYFEKAIQTPRPPKAYWCDTEDFRFSGDYLLAKLLLEEKNLDEAAKQFTEVIRRCEILRKRIQDSPIKITFNDTQRKPFQYLQHVMLECGKKMKALAIAEKGRGRDFFDKIENEFYNQLDSEEVLLGMIKSQGIAVLFISNLEEIGKLCLWFISSEGKLLKQWSIPYNGCKDIFTKLCNALYETQGRLDIEFRGTTTEEDYSLLERAFRMINHNLSGNNGIGPTSTAESFKNSCLLDTTGAKTTNKRGWFFRNTSREPNISCTREERCSLPDLIEKLSELIVRPFQVELESFADREATGNTPRLLVIPQGTTFNIPFSVLKLNGEPLCNHVTIIEAFSFNSFVYASMESQKRTPTGNFQNALIVGNPTHKDNLPNAEEEAMAIATRLGVKPLLRDEATKRAIVEQLPNANLIHFACHGEIGGKGLLLACENPTRSVNLLNYSICMYRCGANIGISIYIYKATGRALVAS